MTRTSSVAWVQSWQPVPGHHSSSLWVLDGKLPSAWCCTPLQFHNQCIRGEQACTPHGALRGILDEAHPNTSLYSFIISVFAGNKLALLTGHFVAFLTRLIPTLLS